MESIGDRKRGDTLSFYAAITDVETGKPVVTDISNIKSQIRTRMGKLIDSFIISSTDTEGKYFLRSEDTSKYPIGTHEIDIQITDNDVTISTETFTITIVQDVTQ